MLDQSFTASRDLSSGAAGTEPPLDGVLAAAPVIAATEDFGAAVGRLALGLLRIGAAGDGELDQVPAVLRQLEQEGLNLQDPPVGGAAAFLAPGEDGLQGGLVAEVTDRRGALVLARVAEGASRRPWDRTRPPGRWPATSRATPRA